MTDCGIKAFQCNNLDRAVIRAEWEKWLRALKLYLSSENVSNPERKRDKLLHLGGQELQEVAFNIPGAIEEYDSTKENDVFAVLVAKLTEHFSPKQNSTFERHMFRNIKSESGESFNTFLIRVRQQANKCSFGNTAQESAEINLKDKIIDTWASLELKKKLLEKERSLNDIIELCQVYEQIGTQSSSMNAQQTGSSSATQAVNKLSFKDRKTGMLTEACNRCGRLAHAKRPQNCPAINRRCTKCERIGHFAIRCQSKVRKHPNVKTQYRQHRQNVQGQTTSED